MFTGIIDHCGIVLNLETIPSGLRLTIQHTFSENLELGESISVDGFCLTVTETHEKLFCCDVSHETIKMTTVKNYQLSQIVNLERALRLSSRLGGHLVTGHIDQTAQIKKIQQVDDFIDMTIGGLEKDSRKLIVKKGSVAINGVSLTINEVNSDGFAVTLIPHTLKCTNLIKLQETHWVNIEFDILARIVNRQLENFIQ